MIPTTFKSNISKELSFPIGAEQINAALEGVSQYEGLSIRFSRHYDQTPSQTRDILDNGELLRVVEAEYRDAIQCLDESRAIVNENGYEKVWRLRVYPVPRDRKKAVRELLLETGLARIRAWLEKPWSQVWRDGQHSCSLEVQSAEKGGTTLRLLVRKGQGNG